MDIIYDHIGIDYDTSRRADPEIAVKIAQLLKISSEGQYLDLACGTGNYTCALNQFGGGWQGCDISPTMLNQAEAKSKQIRWSLEDVNRLNYPDNYFDAVSCILAVHHFNNLAQALCEIARILKPGGRLVFFTSTPEQMAQYWLSQYFPRMIEKASAQMPSLKRLEIAAQHCGLHLAEVQAFFVSNELQDFFLYSGKYQPSIYLSARIRQGISAFCNLCDTDELERGLAQLQLDIATGAIDRINLSSGKNFGDYIFVSFFK